MSGVCWQIAGLLGKFAGIYWLKKINYFKTNENQALVGVLGGDVKNTPNKLFKSDSQRVAFSLCVGFGVKGGMRRLLYCVAHTLTGRYAAYKLMGI